MLIIGLNQEDFHTDRWPKVLKIRQKVSAKCGAGWAERRGWAGSCGSQEVWGPTWTRRRGLTLVREGPSCLDCSGGPGGAGSKAGTSGGWVECRSRSPLGARMPPAAGGLHHSEPLPVWGEPPVWPWGWARNPPGSIFLWKPVFPENRGFRGDVEGRRLCKADPSHRPSECSPNLTSVWPLLPEPPTSCPGGPRPFPVRSAGTPSGTVWLHHWAFSSSVSPRRVRRLPPLPAFGDAERVGPGSVLSPWSLPAASPACEAHLLSSLEPPWDVIPSEMCSSHSSALLFSLTLSF